MLCYYAHAKVNWNNSLKNRKAVEAGIPKTVISFTFVGLIGCFMAHT